MQRQLQSETKISPDHQPKRVRVTSVPVKPRENECEQHGEVTVHMLDGTEHGVMCRGYDDAHRQLATETEGLRDAEELPVIFVDCFTWPCDRFL